MNPFELFNLAVDFHVDQAALSEHYLALQKALHPDNFATHSAQEQRLAMQKVAEINDALHILKDPILRADCIIQLHTGEQRNIEQQSHADIAFLMQQMQWRETLADIEQQQDFEQLLSFSETIQQAEQQILTQLATALTQQQWQQATSLNDKLRFIKKLAVEIERVEQQLTDF